ncbi:hypothetical protein GGR57DRAFT_498710 [Xylariaceae sp. FL1272]|nr:hypothetical protein GGR57DRAFT_498710 [Xylariaceae sp. FL1272]
MSFGYSVGDFITGASLTYQLIQTLSSSRGACSEYQEALVELRAMEQAFIQAGNLIQAKTFAPDTLNGIACIALASIEMIQKFLDRTKDLKIRLGHKACGVESSWAKIGWQLFGRDELRILKTQLHERLTSINTLITMACWQVN